VNEASTLAVYQTLKGHTGAVHAVCISRDETTLCTASGPSLHLPIY
jgi:hypothetical protein